MTVCEVGPRDGLQNEPALLPLEVKVELVRRLVEAGLRRIEVGSFVHPKAVPQMADTDRLCERVPHSPQVTYAGLVLNEKGFERAQVSGVQQVNFAFAATETFNRRNQRASTEESLDAFRRIARRAREAGMRCTMTIGAAFGCPFEGEVPEERVVGFAVRAAEAGADEIVLADTIGVAVPSQVSRLVRHVREAVGSALPIGVHLHNTRNTGYANAYAALEAGAAILDAAVGGTGGCPFAPRATGNIATEDLVYMLHRMGMDTGVDLGRLIETAQWLEAQIGHALPGQVMKAGVFPPPDSGSRSAG